MDAIGSMRSTRGGASLVIAAVVYLIAGCSFDSSAGLEGCEEGERRGSEVCRGGRWVPVGGTDGGGGDGYETSVEGTDGGRTADVEGADGCTPTEERCNGTDDDCDGTVDEECGCRYTGSSKGVCADGTRTAAGQCEPPREYSNIEGVGPGDCEDGLDNDCDGAVDGEDADCGCTGGERRDCYTGPPGTAGTGICRSGHQACVGGEWQGCMDETVPADGEMCGDGVDNDCDGVVDEGCPCDYEGRTEGVCGQQMRDVRGACSEPDSYEKLTDTESHCDQRDNDCDGAVDEGCACDYRDRTAGVCGGQTRDAKGRCPEPADYDGGPERGALCDGIDNDCDGRVDEDGCECTAGTSERCYTGPSGTAGVGICERGTHTCRDGQWGTCTGETTPDATESCGDSRDTDCNGVPDNGCPCDYDGSSKGVCGRATRDATGACQRPSAYEATEQSCGDNRDNDCDGATDGADPDCREPPGGTCSSDAECRGPCESGTCVHRIFATSTTTDGSFGGLQGGDGICRQLANAENLGGNWVSLLSTSNTAATTRVNIVAAVYNLNGDKVADDATDLWDGDIDTPVGYDEKGQTVAGDVWTGSESDGSSKRADCNGWTSDSRITGGQEGRADADGGDWLEDNDGLFDARSCDDSLPLYCVETK